MLLGSVDPVLPWNSLLMILRRVGTSLGVGYPRAPLFMILVEIASNEESGWGLRMEDYKVITALTLGFNKK